MRRNRMLLLAGGITAILLGAGISIPAQALTQRSIISYEGSGNWLESSSGVSGQTVNFVATPTGEILWDFQIETGSYYYLHPNNNINNCMTASTTQYGVIKIEACVGAANQLWADPHNGSGYYMLNNDYWGSTLDDPGCSDCTDAATLGSGNYGNNGVTMKQIA